MKQDSKKKKNSNNRWILFIFLGSFFLSLFFSYVSTTALSGLNVIPAIILVLLVILIGIVFDIVGLAANVAEEETFHAQGSKKVKSSKTAIKLIRNAGKVSSICADVIGDVAGVLSGAMSAIITMKITATYGVSESVQYFVSAMVAALTIGGKAIGKGIAIKHANKIINGVSKLISVIYK